MCILQKFNYFLTTTPFSSSLTQKQLFKKCFPRKFLKFSFPYILKIINSFRYKAEHLIPLSPLNFKTSAVTNIGATYIPEVFTFFANVSQIDSWSYFWIKRQTHAILLVIIKCLSLGILHFLALIEIYKYAWFFIYLTREHGFNFCDFCHSS